MRLPAYKTRSSSPQKIKLRYRPPAVENARKEHFMVRVYRLSAGSIVTLAALLVLVAGTRAQVVIGTPKDDKPLPIDAAGRAKAIEAILKELEERYVFLDVAKKMRQAIEARIERKEYDGVDTRQELAKKLTAHLQEISKNKHLRVMCHSGKLPAPPKGPSRLPKIWNECARAAGS